MVVRVLVVLVLLLSPIPTFAADTASTQSPAIEQCAEAADTQDDFQLAVCCKHCKKGKACGESCISRNKTCHTPPGCACDSVRSDDQPDEPL